MMRFQTMYLDMRPVALKWLGMALTLGCAVLIVLSIKPDADHAFAALFKVFQDAGRVSRLPSKLEFVWACLGSATCRGTILLSWSLPLVFKCLLVSHFIFGVVCWIFGIKWRPEVIAMRDRRLMTGRVEQSRTHSPVPPRRVL